MKINYNLSAYVANAHLLRNEDKLRSSLEKLSSGYKLNHAADDPAGMAISQKMKSQIRGLERASKNASDGVSLLSTAEGALNEVSSILQRMRELAVQAGNDTYAPEDREAMQDEIEQLKKEVDRISTDTEFNKKTILDGSLDSRVYANTRDISLVEVSESVLVGDYEMLLLEDAAHAVVKAQPADLSAYEDGGQVKIPAGSMSINGVAVSFKGGESEEEVYSMIRDAAELAEVNVLVTDMDITTNRTPEEIAENPETEGYTTAEDGYQFGDALVFVSRDSGSKEEISISFTTDDLAGFFGMDAIQDEPALGKDATVQLTGELFSNQATVTADGETVHITDRKGFSMKFDIAIGSMAATLANDPNATGKELQLEVTNIGNMDLQVGANQYQIISVDIPCMSSEALRIADVDVRTVNGTDKSLTAIDAAIERVNSVRSRLGAAQNRLNYTTENLSESVLNMESAMSRIMDVDMAEEMSVYTQMNVLTQAATSVLAQANDVPQQTLQLLQ